jgi:hypothetical protein
MLDHDFAQTASWSEPMMPPIDVAGDTIVPDALQTMELLDNEAGNYVQNTSLSFGVSNEPFEMSPSGIGWFVSFMDENFRFSHTTVNYL